MAVNYTNAVKTARMNATRTHFANGKLQIGTAGMAAVLAEFDLTAGAGSVSDGVWSLAFASGTATASAGGTAAAARIITSGSAADLTGLTVGTSAADIVLDSTSISNGQAVTLTSATITHAS
jgi:hypothetical protein